MYVNIYLKMESVFQVIQDRVEKDYNLFIEINNLPFRPEIDVCGSVVANYRSFVADCLCPLNLIISRIIDDADESQQLLMFLIEPSQLKYGVKICYGFLTSVAYNFTNACLFFVG